MNFDFQPFREEMATFLSTLSGSTCSDLHNPKREIQCGCCCRIALSSSEIDAIVRYLALFALLDWTAQRSKVLEWMRYAEGSRSPTGASGASQIAHHAVYLLPGSSTRRVCKNVLARVVGLGSTAWRNVQKCLKEGKEGPRHGLCGRTSNNWDWTHYFDMTCFFQNLEKEAQPRAMKLVRSLTGDGTVREELRNDEDVLELPSCYRKRGVYRTFLRELGYEIKTDNKGREIERINNSPFEDNVPPSWTSFRAFWKVKYPKLVIQPRAEDLCDDCVIFANQHKYNKRRLRTALGEDSSDDDSDNDEDLVCKEIRAESKEVIRKATEHVEMACKQRQLFNRKKDKAKQDRRNELSQEERTYCYVGDFAQNMCLPNFASEQPGATYYYSPLSVYPFGVVDGSTSPSRLTAHIFYEGKLVVILINFAVRFLLTMVSPLLN